MHHPHERLLQLRILCSEAKKRFFSSDGMQAACFLRYASMGVLAAQGVGE
jgi:hypothetical protein